MPSLAAHSQEAFHDRYRGVMADLPSARPSAQAQCSKKSSSSSSSHSPRLRRLASPASRSASTAAATAVRSKNVRASMPPAPRYPVPGSLPPLKASRQRRSCRTRSPLLLLGQALEQLTYLALERHHHPGWEINDGACGELVDRCGERASCSTAACASPRPMITRPSSRRSAHGTLLLSRPLVGPEMGRHAR
jgi:hypothetical protein